MSAHTIEKYKGYLIEIHYDTDASNPRKEFDNVATMVCWHRRYDLGDDQPAQCGSDYLKMLADDAVGFKCDLDDVPEKHIQAVLEKHYFILPLYLYDHSGISISTGAFSCPWDSGQVGFIYVTKEKARKEWGPPKEGETEEQWATRYLEGEVEEYDQYLTGDVHGYVIKEPSEDWDEDEDDEDDKWTDTNESCWGFYGSDYCMTEAKSIVDHMAEQRDIVNRETELATCWP
jgi:hypothetical protein